MKPENTPIAKALKLLIGLSLVIAIAIYAN